MDGDEVLDYVDFCATGRFGDYLHRFLSHAPPPAGVGPRTGPLYNRDA
jgi:hypothetical protein